METNEVEVSINLTFSNFSWSGFISHIEEDFGIMPKNINYSRKTGILQFWLSSEDYNLFNLLYDNN